MTLWTLISLAVSSTTPTSAYFWTLTLSSFLSTHPPNPIFSTDSLYNLTCSTLAMVKAYIQQRCKVTTIFISTAFIVSCSPIKPSSTILTHPSSSSTNPLSPPSSSIYLTLIPLSVMSQYSLTWTHLDLMCTLTPTCICSLVNSKLAPGIEFLSMCCLNHRLYTL